jgi:hypothetical protein
MTYVIGEPCAGLDRTRALVRPGSARIRVTGTTVTTTIQTDTATASLNFYYNYDIK